MFYTVNKAIRFLILSAVFLCPINLLAEDDARLSYSNTEFNFGKVKQGTVVEHEFDLKNIGTEKLIIRKIHASCGCLVADMESQEILPKETKKLKITFNTSGFEGEEVKTARIYTNDPTNTSVIFKLIGNVFGEFEKQPEIINFDKLRRGERREVSLVVIPKTSEQVIEAIIKEDPLVVRMEDSKEFGNGAKKIFVSITPKAPIGYYLGKVILKTTSKESPFLHIPVRAQIIGDLELVPDIASFGVVSKEGRQEKKQVIKVKNLSPSVLEVLEVSSNNQAVEAKLEQVVEGKEWRIVISLNNLSKGLVRGTITIRTDNQDKSQREILLPVYAIISEN